MLARLLIPARVTNAALSRFGEAGRAWLEALPHVLASVAADLHLQIGAPFEPGGASAWTAPVTRADGSDAVLKVHIVPQAAREEAVALHLWDGNGAVRLLEAKDDALLIERCHPGLRLDSVADFEAEDAIATALIRRLHRDAGSGEGQLAEIRLMRSFMEERAELTVQRYASLQPALPRLQIDRAVALMRELAVGTTLIHGDFAPGNIIAAQGDRFLAIDPAPLIGDPAYDIVQYLLFRGGSIGDRAREWATHIRRVAGAVGADPERVRLWMFAKLMHDALWSAEQGDPNWRDHADVAQIAWDLRIPA